MEIVITRVLDLPAATLLSALLLLFALVAPAAAQQPSTAQRNAIRQACPADYQTHCAAVPAGGKASLECLERNLASLSPGCQQAVKAVAGGGAAPRATAAPATGSAIAAPAPSAGAAAPPPMSPRQQLTIVRQYCGGDYRALCRGVPLGGGRAIACLRANASSLSPGCRNVLSAARSSR
ncbi:MAG: cysteine rich repeat-containing protein [Stellaceae bacterium]